MQFIDDDIVDLRRPDGSVGQYYWGDACEVLGQEGKRKRVRIHGPMQVVDEGFIAAGTALRDDGILRMSMVDVQQGDGMIVDTPGGKVIFIDGGDNQLFARHAAARYRGTSAENPLIVDAVLVTHGDADHFEGLNKLGASEDNEEPRKRIFMTARRVYHNGLAKRGGKVAGKARKDVEMFGATVPDSTGRPYCVELVDDVRTVADAELNQFFRPWKKTIERWDQRLRQKTGAALESRRLDQHSQDAFDFLKEEGLEIETLGPISEEVEGKTGLAFLAQPPDDAALMLGLKPGKPSRTWSASHTVNGHSISFRLRYGNVRFLFTGDLNQESMNRLREALPGASLRAEILKTPHHGSSDFNFAFLQEVGPVVSIISSGDESEQKEHIHPRATLMAALGKASRTTPAVIFCTELAAFFKMRGYVPDPDRPDRKFFAFERSNYGIIHVRTDGERVPAFTHSGERGMNEAYRFTVSPSGEIQFAPKAVKQTAPALP
ncbi:MAG TPA: hypothetical protein VIT45_08250 [Allosphingosinicella sp.]